MRKFKRFFGLAMATVLIATQAMPVMAEGTDIGGTGNVLDYAVETVVTPTSLKIALNPNQYSINTKYVKVASDATVTQGTTYYTEADGTYTVADIEAFAANTTYYTAVTSNAQVVSLNYGIANKSTEAKDIAIDIKASYTAVSGNKTPITFVDSAAKTQAKTEQNPDGAEKDELKMYLAVASAATPEGNTVPVTADTFAKATAFTANTTYYTKSEAGVFAEAGTQPTSDTFKNATYYVATTTIGPEITNAQMSDVTMTAATGASVVPFEPAEADDVKAKVSTAYKLGEATYSVKTGEIIDFNTTQDQLASKLELSAIGGVSAFTITGAINANADWTAADTKAIKFTPIYTVTNATGDEEAVTGGYNQIKTEPAPTAVAAASIYDGDVYIRLVTGENAVANKVTSVKVDGEVTTDYTVSGTIVVSGVTGSGEHTVLIVYDGVSYTGTVTIE